MSSEQQPRGDANASAPPSGETTPDSGRAREKIDPPAGSAAIRPIGVPTILQFLAGQRSAILRIGASPQALWAGLAFVLLAGLFREYDQESLLHQPWYLIIPLLASLGLSFGLFVAVKLLPECRHLSGREYRQLLTGLWMTAPLAVIYAIPVEHLFAAFPAVKLNLSFLGIVSVWRVLLFARVTAVLFGSSMLRTLVPILFLADTLVVLAIFASPLPLLQIMGGISLTESEALLKEISLLLLLVGIPAWLILFAMTTVLSSQRRPTELPERPPAAPVEASVWFTGGVGLVSMLFACLLTQPPQFRRFEVEYLLQRKRFPEAHVLLSRHPQSAFPPHWEPGPGELSRQQLLVELAAMQGLDPLPDWVADAYGDRLDRFIGYGFYSLWFWADLPTDDYRVLLAFFQRYPDQQRIFRPARYEKFLDGISQLAGQFDEQNLSPEDTERIAAVLPFLELVQEVLSKELPQGTTEEVSEWAIKRERTEGLHQLLLKFLGAESEEPESKGTQADPENGPP